MIFKGIRFAATLAAMGTIGILSAFCQGMPSPYSSTATYTEGDLVRIGINYFRCLATNTNKNPANNTGCWELYRLRANNTVSPPVYRIYVGTGHSFTNLYNAWNYVANAVIDKGATLQLYIDTSHGNLNENFSAAFNLDHPFGSRIQIVGDNASNITLTFTNPTDGFDIDSGNTFGFIQNLGITNSNGNTANGISVDGGANLTVANVSISGFYTGVSVTNAGKLRCTRHSSVPCITVSSFGNGIMARDSSYIYCEYANLVGNAGGSNIGIQANYHSEIDANSATIANIAYAFYSANDSSFVAQNSSCSNVSAYSYYATDRAFLRVNGASGGSFYADYGGFIDATSSTASIGYGTDSGSGAVIMH